MDMLACIPYIDEIVIIDSSSVRFYEKLSEYFGDYSSARDKNIKILHIPPLGYADIYQSLGLSISKNNLIIYIEDDEYISQNDLIALSKIIYECYPKFKAFLLRRKEHYLRDYTIILRVFDKRYVYAPGIIHWHFITKVKPKLIPITIDHVSKITLKERLRELRRYALIDSYHIGYKVYKIISASDKGEILYKVDGSSLNRIPKTMLNLVTFFRKLCSRLLSDIWADIAFVLIVFNFYSVFKTVSEVFKIKNPISGLIEGITYPLLITLYTLRSPYRHAKIWCLTIKNNGFSNLIWKTIPNISDCLNYEDPIRNLTAVINTIVRQEN